MFYAFMVLKPQREKYFIKQTGTNLPVGSVLFLGLLHEISVEGEYAQGCKEKATSMPF